MAAEHLHGAVGDLERDAAHLVARRAWPRAARPRRWSSFQAASQTRRRAASISIAMSASLNAIACLRRDRRAEGLALLGVVARELEGARAPRRRRAPRARRARARTSARRSAPASPPSRAAAGTRTPSSAQLRGRQRLDARGCARASTLRPARVARHEEELRRCRPRRRVTSTTSSPVEPRHQALRAVEHVVAAVAARRRRRAGRVGAEVRLGAARARRAGSAAPA